MIDTIVMPIAKELWQGVFFKATAIMTIAGLLTVRFRRSSAAARHAIWGAAFLILIILPVASYLAHSSIVFVIESPARMVRTSPGEAAPRGGYSEARRHDSAAAGAAIPNDRGNGSSRPAETAGADETGSPYTGRAASGAGDSSARGMRGKGRSVSAARAQALHLIPFSLWLFVAALLVARLVMQVRRVDGITRRAIPAERGGLDREIERLVGPLGIKQRVRVMLSEETAMPFAWGVVRPVVVLPIDAPEWPEDQLRSVMIHELAHVARWDYLVHIVVETAWALYWPNPIVWLAARESVMERERACDDFALLSGTRSADYAAHLLYIAQSQIESGTPVPAVSMAGEPRLKERIEHVMNAAMNRAPMKRSILITAAAAILVVTLPFSSMALRSSAWEIPHTRDLIERLAEAPGSQERSMAAWWLGEHEAGKAVEPLLEALKDDSRTVRLTSAWALGEIKDRGSIPGLIETLQSDADPLVREMAVLALGEIEDPSAIKALQAAYEADANLALAVIWALGEIAGRGDREADRLREDIIDRLGRRAWDNEEVWTGRIARRLPRERDVRRLIDKLEGGDEDERRGAAFALGAMGIRQDFESLDEVEASVRALIAALEDPEPEVRAMAVWALDETNPSRKDTFRFHYRGRDKAASLK